MKRFKHQTDAVLYFVIACLGAMVMLEKDLPRWLFCLCFVLNQGLLVLKAKRSKPDKPEGE